MPNESENTHTRRTVLAGVALAGVATVVTACSPGGGSSQSTPASEPSPATDSEGMPQSARPHPISSGSGTGGGTALGAASGIPVGGGKVFAREKVVVTQPQAGQFKAFTAVCTHAGCIVANVSDGVINCPCHGSQFHIQDGTVARGPAQAPLPAKSIAVSNGQITLP